MRKRVISLTVVVCMLLATTIGRIGYIIFNDSYTTSDGYNSYSIMIDKKVPNLYFSNNSRINNNKTGYLAVIRPNARCISELDKVFSTKDKLDILEKLKKGYPVSIKLDEKIDTKYIKVFETTYSENTLKQLLNKESSGLLSYIDNEIGEKRINYHIDAKGRLLDGDDGELIFDNYFSKRGLTLTIDKTVQMTAYNACKDMKSGCVVVMEVKSSKILACVTKPDNSYVNKLIQQYPLGSVFKLVASACALENNCDISYNCIGKIKVGDTVFSCSHNQIHGYQNLKSALANSCNCYFVNLALALGADKLLRTANSFGFNESTELYDNWVIKNANMPTKSDLNSKGQLSLFGFGQGLLLSTPLQVCSTLCTIGNMGVYNKTKLVSSFVDDDGTKTEIDYLNGIRAIDKDIAKILLEYMHYVVTDGTARNANTSANKSAGKTGTAQSGQYILGKEQLNTWFAGVYPYDNPKYAIVIMTENGSSGSRDCCPIFKTIVENLY